MANKNIFVEQRIIHSIVNNALDGIVALRENKQPIIEKVDNVLLSKTLHQNLDVEQRSKMVLSSFEKSITHVSNHIKEQDKTKESRMVKVFTRECKDEIKPFLQISQKHLGPNISLNNSLKKAFTMTQIGAGKDSMVEFSFPIRQVIQKEHEHYLKNKSLSSYKNSSRYKNFKSIMKGVNIDNEKLNPLDLSRVTSSLSKEFKNQHWEEMVNISTTQDLSSFVDEFNKKFNEEIYNHRPMLKSNNKHRQEVSTTRSFNT